MSVGQGSFLNTCPAGCNEKWDLGRSATGPGRTDEVLFLSSRPYWTMRLYSPSSLISPLGQKKTTSKHRYAFVFK